MKETVLKNLTEAVRNFKLSLSMYGLSLSLYKRRLSLYKLKLSLKFSEGDYKGLDAFRLFMLRCMVRKSPKPCAVPGCVIVMLLL